ncbi:MAG: hypothetical protein WA210_12265 [Burkholderiaceae bacterium]
MKPINALAASLLLACGTVAADPGYYVVTTYSDAGKRTLDFRYWTLKFDGMPEVIWPELGLGYGVTDRWTTELFASWIGSSQMSTSLKSWNWQNDYLLTQGQYPVDLAVHTQLIHVADTGWAFEVGPAMQTDIGRTQLNLNFFLDRAFRTTMPRRTELKYQWQVRHRWQRGLHFGLQGFGELGPWDDWYARSQQSHRAGPALFGKFNVGDGTALNWQAAYLYGKTVGINGHMFTARVHLDF